MRFVSPTAAGPARSRTNRRGFTLIEILIAASVLGLGVLGIATLFAGAARQQQIASDQTDSARFARNVDALLAERFDRFSGAATAEDAGLGTRPFFKRGQWHAVAMAPMGGVASGQLDGTLMLDRSDNGLRDQTAFGVAGTEDQILFRLPWTDPDDVPSQMWANPIRYSSLDAAYRDGAMLRPSPFGRLQPGFKVVATFAEETLLGVSSQGGPVYALTPSSSTPKEFIWRDWNDVEEIPAEPNLWPHDPDAGAQNENRLILLDPADADMSVMPPRLPDAGFNDPGIVIDLDNPTINDPPFATIDEINLPNPGGTAPAGSRTTLLEIRLEDVSYREDRLLSLQERLAYTNDEAFPGGRRPARGVSLLYRRTLDGQDQLLTIAYTLEPLGRVDFDPEDEFAFVPPETFERLYDTSADVNAYGMLSQVQLELSFDDALQTYTLRAASGDNEWAIERGQILVIASRNERVNPISANRTANPKESAGAGAPVRVVSTRRDPMNGELIAVLDDSPREADGGSMWTPATDPVEVYAWALRPVVRSSGRSDNDVDWRVRATGAQVVTLGGS